MFGGTIVARVDEPMPAAHVALVELARPLEFPLCELRPGAFVPGTDGWRRWLGRFVPLATSGAARQALAAHAAARLAPRPDVWIPQHVSWSSPEFTTGPWQTCGRCGGRRWWHHPRHGDCCTVCEPSPAGGAA